VFVCLLSVFQVCYFVFRKSFSFLFVAFGLFLVLFVSIMSAIRLRCTNVNDRGLVYFLLFRYRCFIFSFAVFYLSLYLLLDYYCRNQNKE
jgi:hypothetical protein